MDPLYDISFYIAHVSLVMLLVLGVIVVRFRTRTNFNKQFVIFLAELFIWTACVIAVNYGRIAGNNALAEGNGQLAEISGNVVRVFEYLTYIGIAFIAATTLTIGISFNGQLKNRKWVQYLLYIVPFITQIVLWTEFLGLHNAFYASFDPLSAEPPVGGWYSYVHIGYSYLCLIAGMIFFVRFALNSRGDSRWQAVIMCGGSVMPIVVNVLYVLKLVNFFATPIAFLVTSLTYIVGIFRFNLLRVNPIALRTVIDKISDLYVVIDGEMRIMDYNEPFYIAFKPYFKIKKNADAREAIGGNVAGMTPEKFAGIVNDCRETNAVFGMEFKLITDEGVKFYMVEFTPLTIDKVYCGCILLLRDVTQAKTDMEEIRRNQSMLVERERLASLGNLMGGIAHNLKTPIVTISGRLESLRALIDEYEESVGNAEVTKEDHSEIAGEMRRETEKIRGHLSYISDIISAVKAQTVKYNAGVEVFFTVGELIKRVEILLQHELMRKGCELLVELLADPDLSISGDITSLVQVIDNIVINAIHAYKGAKGAIRLKIRRDKDELIISIADKAGGIKKEVQDKLFRQMITTKGTEGTGLGLYISFSTIVGMFKGNMDFVSNEGEGTEFTITLPINKN